LSRQSVDDILKNAHSYAVNYRDSKYIIYELESNTTYFNFFNIEYGFLSITSQNNVYSVEIHFDDGNKVDECMVSRH